MTRRFRLFARDSRGLAAIEVAFIMPFLLLLYFGLIDLTALITLSRKVTYSSSVVADLVTQNKTTVAAADIVDYFSAAKLVMQPTPIGGVRVEVFDFRNMGGIVIQLWSKSSTGGASCGAAPSTAGMTNLMTDGNDLVVARVCTIYTPYIATFLGQKILGATSFTLSEEIALRPRTSATLVCIGC
ncbi:MAG: TadE/TadG family type IV pilus assembly protein [Hyphomicrobiales bacterium]